MPVKEKLLETLKAIGFSEREARIYLTVLELNEALPGSVSQRSGVKRATTYQLLDKLAKKGLVSVVKKNGHLFYRAKDPVGFIEEEKKEAEKLQGVLKDLHEDLPKLHSLHGEAREKMEVSVFDGQEGLTKMLKEMAAFRGKRHVYSHLGNDITIFEDSVAIISREEQTGVLIHNRHIARAQKILLEKHFS
jgi:sugar-specific transcriptional regulator TrmB